MAAIVTAYRDGADLVLALKERKWTRGLAVYPAYGEDVRAQDELQRLDELEMCLARGSDLVQSQYERNSRMLGEAFASGDGTPENKIPPASRRWTDVRYRDCTTCGMHTPLCPVLHSVRNARAHIYVCVLEIATDSILSSSSTTLSSINRSPSCQG